MKKDKTTNDRIRRRLCRQIKRVSKDIVAKGGGNVRFSCVDRMYQELSEQGYSDQEAIQILSHGNGRANLAHRQRKIEMLKDIISEAQKLTDNGKGTCTFTWREEDAKPKY